MTDTNEKIRSLFLTALMVFSVFAGTIAFTGGAAAAANVGVNQATEYNANTGGTTVEVALNNTLSSSLSGSFGTSSGDVTVIVDGNKNPSAFTTGTGASAPSSTGPRVEIGLAKDVSPNRNLTIVLNDVTASGSDSTDVVAKDIDVTSTTFTPSGSSRTFDNVYRGETIAVEDTSASSSTSVLIEEYEGGVVAEDTYTSNSNVYVFDTSNLDTGQRYNITVDGTEKTGFKVSDLGLSAQAEDNDITNEDDVIANATATRGGKFATATLLDSDGNEVSSISKKLQSNSRVDFNFGNISAASGFDAGDGPYTVEVVDNQTGVTVETDQINVSEAQEGSASLESGVVTDERGDVTNVTVQVDNTDTATLFIGDDDDDNYAIQAEVTDDNGDGQVVVQFNSYTAGARQNAQVLSVADSDDDITVEGEFGSFDRGVNPTDSTNLDADVGSVSTAEAVRSDLANEDSIEAASYSMNVTSGSSPNYGNADTVGTLRLNERSTESIRSWVAPAGTDITDDDVGVYERIGNNLTQSNEIAESDVVVHQIQASGIEGALQYELANGGASSADAALFQAAKSSGPLNLTVNKTNVGANSDDKTLSLNASNTDVVTDSNNNTYFVAVKTSQVDYNDNTNIRRNDNDDQITANFTAKKGALEVENDKADFATDDFKFVSLDATINTDSNNLVTVQAAQGQEITGTTSAAPGSEVTVRIDSESESNPFVLRPETIVQPDGTFTATQSFADQSAGVNFTAQFRRGGTSIGDQEDGRIVGADTATVSISDQESDGSQVVVDSAQLSSGGFIVIHDGTLLEGEVAGSVVGSSDYLEAGSHEDITITLDEPQDGNFTAIAMPHLDTNGNQAYDFPDADGPYTANGSAVTDAANVTVTAGEEPTETETEPPATETETEPPATETEMQTEMATTEMTTEAETTAESGPGFTAAIALIALIAAALLAVRRNN